jgi:hypothetical protein
LIPISTVIHSFPPRMRSSPQPYLSAGETEMAKSMPRSASA